MKMKNKLVASFAAMASLVLIAAALGAFSSAEVGKAFREYVDGPQHRVDLAHEVLAATEERAISARNLVLVKDPARLKLERDIVARSHAEVGRRLAALVSSAAESGDPKEVSLVNAIARVEADYGPVALDIVDKATNGNLEAAIRKMQEECIPLLEDLGEASGAYMAYIRDKTLTMVRSVEGATETMTTAMIATLLIGVSVAVAMSVFIPMSLMRALGADPAELGSAARRITGGDLSPMRDAAKASPGSVLASMASMREALVTIVAQVRTGSDNLATASAEIAQGNQDLSSRTEEQASALQQTASAMEELDQTVRQNAENASQADQLARETSAAAVQGGEVVDEVIGTMKGINESSQRIAEIISVIDGIAFQTNILALNAAVEAARAGEQGRGFAVVAGEVRSLAHRSANAAREIKDLIGESVERVEQGTALVDKAGTTMQDVVAAVQRVTQIVGEISNASAEQSHGVAEVGRAVVEMDQNTQHNAALVEQSAAAAASLRQQAQELVQAVAAFRNVEAHAAPAGAGHTG
jgi:methyl-accepting chemotaxis protein-1 (serine sensor receptor)